MAADKLRRMDGSKLLWHMREVKGWQQGERIAPIHIDMGIAKFCNVKCVFCYGKFQQPKPVFIPRDALLNIISDAYDIGVKSLAFIGDGEPTCNPYLYEALDLCKKLQIDTAISTNAVLVNTEEKAKQILSACTWARVCISAGTQAGYEKIHGVDKFKEAVKAIQLLVETKKKFGYRCDIGMQAVYIPGVMDEEMIAESALALALDVDYFVIKQCSLPDAGESGMEIFDVNAYDSEKVQKVLAQCESMSTERTQIIPKWQTIKQKGIRPYHGCLAVPFISEISGDGSWYPCGFMFGGRPEVEQYKFADLTKERLKDVFNSCHYWNVIENMEKFNVHSDCKGACRLDACNEFLYDYINPPRGVNFI